VLKGGEAHGETHWLTKRGQPRLVAWSNTAAKNDEGTVDYVIRTGVDVTEREEAQTQARDSHAAARTMHEKGEVTRRQHQDELQALTARLLGLQEGGNKDLARELHDDLSQKLAALGMEVSTLLQASVSSPDKLPDRVRALSVRINGLAEEVHAMSRRLHPAILDELGLDAALKGGMRRLLGTRGRPGPIRVQGCADFAPGRRLPVPLSRGSGESPKHRQARQGYESQGCPVGEKKRDHTSY
jgi:signal transduction histidine kinase